MAVDLAPRSAEHGAVRDGSHRRPPSRVRAVLPLARAEGGRLIRSPIVVGGSLLSLAVFGLITWNQAPVLQRDDIWAAGSVLALASATLLAANLAATRSRRHRTDELFEPAAVGIADRTLAHVLSVAWPAGLAMIVITVEMGFLAARDPVGAPNVLELMIGPAVVALGGVLGVALARWWAFAAVGPLALVALASLQTYLLFHLPGGSYHQSRVRWLGPWVPLAASASPPREIVIRPTGSHLLYLAGIAAAIAAITLLRHGPTPRRTVLLVAGAGLAVFAAVIQTRPPTLTQQLALLDLAAHPERHQVCETRGLAEICVYPGYRGWIDRWGRLVQATLRPVPTSARPTLLEVRQFLSDPWAADLPRDEAQGLEDELSGVPYQGANRILVGTEWGGGRRAGRDELAMGLLVASRAVGLPGSPLEMEVTRKDIERLVRATVPEERARYRQELLEHPENVGGCTVGGQARAAVAVWLAARVSSDASATLQQIVSQDPALFQLSGEPGHASSFGYTGPWLYQLQGLGYDVGTGSPVLWTKAEADYALQLLRRAGGSVRETLRDHWQEVIHPATPSSRLVELFGLRPFPTLEDELRRAGLDPNQARQLRSEQGYQIPCR